MHLGYNTMLPVPENPINPGADLGFPWERGVLTSWGTLPFKFLSYNTHRVSLARLCNMGLMEISGSGNSLT